MLPEVNSLSPAHPGKFTRFCYKAATLLRGELLGSESSTAKSRPAPRSTPPFLAPFLLRPRVRAGSDSATGSARRVRPFDSAPLAPGPAPRTLSAGPRPHLRGASRLRPRPGATRLQERCRSSHLRRRAATGSPQPPLSRARSPADEAASAARNP